MSRHRTIPLLTAFAALALAAPAYSQGRSAVTTAELEAAVTARPSGNREAIRDFLAIPQVQSMASRMGISTSELSAGVGTLDQASLDQIAQQTAVGDVARAGGSDTIVISSTVIIIALLIIILLVK